jgi:Icc-related predicted phosphoesterase
MKILALSDIHGNEYNLRKILLENKNNIDAITISGDITNFGNYNDLKNILDIIDEIKIPYFYILGNCDPKEFKNGIESKGTCVESKCEKINDITILGAGGSTFTPFNTLFEISEDEIINNLKKAICEEITILLTHNPPFASIVDLTRYKIHVGSKKLREFVLQYSPKIYQCGHIHEARGKEIIGNTLVFNPGPVMRGYYAIIDLKNINVELKSIS